MLGFDSLSSSCGSGTSLDLAQTRLESQNAEMIPLETVKDESEFDGSWVYTCKHLTWWKLLNLKSVDVVQCAGEETCCKKDQLLLMENCLMWSGEKC